MVVAVRRSAGRLSSILAALWLSACGVEPTVEAPVFELLPTSFARLEGWQDDDPSDALIAFRRSCRRLNGRPDDVLVGRDPRLGTVANWRPVCVAAEDEVDATSSDEVRKFFEIWFQPYHVVDDGNPEGLFTGYYEPLLHGSRQPQPPYTVPLYAVPNDLVRIDLGRFNPDLNGYSIAGRINGRDFVPYHSRAEIDRGALTGRGLELIWVDDPIDKFFLQIQGSGQVKLDDGALIRVGYAGQNGQPYHAIGRDLIEIGALDPDEVSLQSIRGWLEANPGDANAIMARNRSYVFFHENSDLEPDDGPIGAQGVSLTAGRSLAVDPRYVPFGAPLWLDTTTPWPEGEGPLRRLMIAQDTGGAIKGIVRGDVFWGAGERAEWIAGRMKDRGRYVLLLPRTVVPTS